MADKERKHWTDAMRVEVIDGQLEHLLEKVRKLREKRAAILGAARKQAETTLAEVEKAESAVQ